MTTGEVFAILGSSGAGKTTLLDVLAGRKNTGTLKGDVYVNGHKLVPERFKYVSAYVMQDDILLGSLTTKETLEYTAELRFPLASKEELARKVQVSLKTMALEHSADTFVGNAARRGLSGRCELNVCLKHVSLHIGGEKKRLAIALQLLADPSVLFLDEPTTGLDAYNSVVVMSLVSKVAKEQGRTVCR